MQNSKSGTSSKTSRADSSQPKQYEECIVNDKKIYICLTSDCGKNFKFLSEMKRHLANHSNQRPFVCAFPDCGKSFKRPDALSNHFRIHSKKVLFECPFPECGSQFTTNSSLKYHLLKHQKDPNPQCPPETKSIQESSLSEEMTDLLSLDNQKIPDFVSALERQDPKKSEDLKCFSTTVKNPISHFINPSVFPNQQNKLERAYRNHIFEDFEKQSQEVSDYQESERNKFSETQIYSEKEVETNLNNIMDIMMNANNQLKNKIKSFSEPIQIFHPNPHIRGLDFDSFLNSLS